MNENNAIKDFADSYDFYYLFKSPTCFKSYNPRCIDLILTNRKHNFKNTITAETGLSDFHAMIITVLKGGFRKKGPRIIHCRYYSNYSVMDVISSIINDVIPDLSINRDYDGLDSAITKVLNNYAHIKKKYIRANDGLS